MINIEKIPLNLKIIWRLIDLILKKKVKYKYIYKYSLLIKNFHLNSFMGLIIMMGQFGRNLYIHLYMYAKYTYISYIYICK